MARRYAPNYMLGPQRGWYSPRFYGGGAGMRGPMFQAPMLQAPMFQPPMLIQLTTPPNNNNQEQQQQQPASEPVQGTEVTRRSANIVRANATISQEKRKFRYSGMLLCAIASAIISLGVSNVVVTAVSVMTSQGDLGCFDASNPYYYNLGPSNEFMKAFDWSWISSGLWTAVVVYVGGNIVGSIVALDSVKTRIFSVIALTSLLIFIPVCLAFSILDAILSNGCREMNPIKFGTPVAIAILSLLEFLVLVYIVVKFRREAKVAAAAHDDNFNPSAVEAQARGDQVAYGRPGQQGSFGSGFGPTAAVPQVSREPNVTLINIQPPPIQPPLAPRPVVASPMPYVALNRPLNNVRWQPRPMARPDYLTRWAGRPAPGMFSASLYPSMAQGGYGRPAY